MSAIRYVVRVAFAAAVFLFSSANVFAEWRVSIESKTVPAGQTNVHINFNIAFDLCLAGVTVPIAVRAITPGSFWAGQLPYDTSNNPYFLCDLAHNVEWHWSTIPYPWTTQMEQVRPGVPGSPCDAGGDVGYDGVSPDHFSVDAAGTGGSEPAKPEGLDAVTIIFDVTNVPGQFEFDTACFTGALCTIYLIDNIFPPTDHGPTGTGECTFDKGVITIVAGSPTCGCGIKGDLNNDELVNPLDAIYMMNFVYRSTDNRVYPADWGCQYDLGDGNCDGAITPLDVILFNNLIYRSRDYMCNPCTEGYDPWLGGACGG